MKFKSLKEVCAAANALVLNTEEELKTLAPEIIIEITIAAQKYISIQANKYAQRLWGQNFSNTRVTWVYYNQWKWLGRYCERLIEINMESIFCYNYINLLDTIIHELCHKKYLNHSMKFWTYYYECLKCVGLVKQNERMEDVLRIKDRCFGKRKETEKMGIKINRLADLCDFPSHSQALDNFETLRRHKVFNLKYHGINNSRYFSKEYNDLVTELCTEYDIDKREIDVE